MREHSSGAIKKMFFSWNLEPRKFERKEHDLGRPLCMFIFEMAMSLNFDEIQRELLESKKICQNFSKFPVESLWWVRVHLCSTRLTAYVEGQNLITQTEFRLQ